MSKQKRTPEFDFVQMEKLAEHLVDGRPLMDILSEDFFTQGPRLIAKVRISLQNRDFEAMRDGAHALRGPSSTLGLSGFADLCRRLEECTDLSVEDLTIAAKELERSFSLSSQWLRSQVRIHKAS